MAAVLGAHPGRHHAEPMTLPQLAQQARASPSHLSYLLRMDC
jgi:AraC-like DNA-binding protein